MNDFNENIFEEKNKNPVPGEFAAGGSGEYHYIRPEATRNAYSDASYIPCEDAAALPRRYRCGETTTEKKVKKEKSSRRVPLAGVIALCLVCAILGGAGGGVLAGEYIQRKFADEPYIEETFDPAPEQSGPIINVTTPSNTPSLGTNVVADGSALTASEIYTLACSQVVAVTTEITYKNYFGYTSSSAVSGSGFLISADGYILTNYHVIEDAAQGGYDISVYTYDGSEYIASIVGYEAENDVAVLKVEGENFSAATLGDSDGMVVGEQVYAVGNPLGELEYTMTGGMVSALDRDITTYDSETGLYNAINMFQIDAAVNSGNSGGPVYNHKGQVIGIVTAKYSDSGVEGLGFAVPINDALAIAEDLITKGYVSGKAYMGIGADTLPASVNQYYGLPSGAYVMSVEAGSAAEKAGIEVGDIIIAMGDTPISSSDELISAKKAYRAGDTTTITVSRSGGDIVLEITFDEEVPGESSDRPSQGNQQNQQSQNPYYGYGQIPGFGGFGGFG